MATLLPARAVSAAPHIICDTNSYKLTANGQTVYVNNYGNPLDGDALAQALRAQGSRLHSIYGEVIVEIHGNQHRGMVVNGSNLNISNTVSWGTSGPVRDIRIIGGDKERAAKIGTIAVANNAGDLLIRNATLMNDATAYCPLLVNQGGIVGFMQIYDCNFMPKDPTAWSGKGMKWNIRGHGCARWDLRNIKFHAAIEHNFYGDNCQGDSYFVNLDGGDTGRTMLQITNRTQSGPTGFGNVFVKGCVSNNIFGQGGSDFTFAGIGEGTIYFFNNISNGNPGGSQGALVCYSDAPHGLYLNPNGFTTGGLVVKNFVVNHPNANRDHLAIAGVEQAIISEWDITGNKTAIALNSHYGGGIDNGAVGLYVNNAGHPSQNPGWKSYNKITKYDFITMHNNVLNDADIDRLEYIRN